MKYLTIPNYVSRPLTDLATPAVPRLFGCFNLTFSILSLSHLVCLEEFPLLQYDVMLRVYNRIL